jgi:hypothetical protein
VLTFDAATSKWIAAVSTGGGSTELESLTYFLGE